MIQATYIARASDSLFLCEFRDQNTNYTNEMRTRDKKILAHEKSKTGEMEIVNIDSQTYGQVLCERGVIIMTVCSNNFPKKLAKAFSSELLTLFEERMQSEFGSVGRDLRSKLETIEKPYHYVSFDKVIKKKVERFRDVESPDNLDRINSDLYDIQSSLTQSFELLMDKDKNIGDIMSRAQNLKVGSEKFKNDAAKTRLSLQLRQYLLFIVIGIVILLVVAYKFVL